MIVNGLLALMAYKTKALTLNGTLLALALGVFVYYINIKAYIVLFVYFISVVFVERIILKKKMEQRNSGQVISNFALALFSMVLFLILKNHKFFVLYCTMLSVSICDTFASTIGSKFAKNVYSITKFEKVEKGISGGVSFCGTVFGILGSVIISAVYCVLFHKNTNVAVLCNAIMITAMGTFGMIIDSILGDVFQKKYYCIHCHRVIENQVCCGVSAKPIGIHILTNSQVNICSAGMIFVIYLLL